MRYLFTCIFFISIFTFISCKKDVINVSTDYNLSISEDSLRFDTVFTSRGSVTYEMKIYNRSDAPTTISEIQLMGGDESSFKINVDGFVGPRISNLSIDANDSVYLFATVNIDPSDENAPFVVRDSVKLTENGSSSFIQLEAYGQNANYIRGEYLTENTFWDNSKPYVILDGILVSENTTLTISPGTRIYLHANAPFIVQGTLIAEGTKEDSIVFQGDRLEADYKDLPASWPGMYFTSNSSGNVFTHTIIKNAFQGIVSEGNSNPFPKIALKQCVIDNIYDIGIVAYNTSILAENCRITNCGLNVLLTSGGNYQFIHNTIVSYSNIYITHKKPVFAVSNWDSVYNLNTYDMHVELTNNILWGSAGVIDDEILISKKGDKTFIAILENNLYRAKNTIPDATLLNNLINIPPAFDSINEARRYYDFRINKGASPAINKGKNLFIPLDLEDNPRDDQPDIGCYEKKG